MKKIAFLACSLLLACACVFGACANSDTEFVSIDAADLLQEDFGIALKKGDSEMKAAVDAVVKEWSDNGNLEKYFNYYDELAVAGKNPTAPEGLKLEWDLSANTEVLDMYTESGFPPYEFLHTSGYVVSDGNASEGTYSIAGLDVAIACQVAENLRCKLVIHDVLFDTIITNLNKASGKALAAAGLTINEERAQEVDFSEIYSSSTLSIVSDKQKSYNSLKALDGLKIGVQEGTSGDLIATQAKGDDGYTYVTEEGEDGQPDKTATIKLGSPETEIVTFKTYAAALAALQSGKIDAIFMDKVPSLLLIANI